MRILYFANLDQVVRGTAIQRMHALADLGHSMIPFDIEPYIGKPGSQWLRIRRSIGYRLGWGYPVGTLNEDIVAFARKNPHDLIWIDKGMWITDRAVSDLRSIQGAPVVHFTPDPALTFHQTRIFNRSLREYDILITTKRYEIDLYKAKGARRLICVPQGYDPTIFSPHETTAEERSNLGSDVCLVGHYEEHYRDCVRTATQVTDRVAVWGGRWPNYVAGQPWLKPVVRGSGIFHHDYAKALSCAKIALGVLSKWVAETSTTRTFEIPACGTFMLAERTDEHLEYYQQGVEAEFFGDMNELREKIRFYLKNDRLREEIARRGRERCLTGGYSYEHRMRQCIDQIMNGKDH